MFIYSVKTKTRLNNNHIERYSFMWRLQKLLKVYKSFQRHLLLSLPKLPVIISAKHFWILAKFPPNHGSAVRVFKLFLNSQMERCSASPPAPMFLFPYIFTSLIAFENWHLKLQIHLFGGVDWIQKACSKQHQYCSSVLTAAMFMFDCKCSPGRWALTQTKAQQYCWCIIQLLLFFQTFLIFAT